MRPTCDIHSRTSSQCSHYLTAPDPGRRGRPPHGGEVYHEALAPMLQLLPFAIPSTRRLCAWCLALALPRLVYPLGARVHIKHAHALSSWIRGSDHADLLWLTRHAIICSIAHFHNVIAIVPLETFKRKQKLSITHTPLPSHPPLTIAHTPNPRIPFNHPILAPAVPARNVTMTDAEQRSMMAIWCMSNSMLIAGNDLRTMTPQTK